MRKLTFKIAATLALLGSGSALATQSKPCLSRPEVRGLVGFMLPSVLDSTIKTCASQLGGSSFFKTRGPQLVGELTPGKDPHWPMAKVAFAKMGGDDGTMAKMPDEVLKPMLEGTFTGMISNKITAKNCKDADRVLSPMAPLPAENVVDLMTEIMMLALRDDKQTPTCRD